METEVVEDEQVRGEEGAEGLVRGVVHPGLSHGPEEVVGIVRRLICSGALRVVTAESGPQTTDDASMGALQGVGRLAGDSAECQGGSAAIQDAATPTQTIASPSAETGDAHAIWIARLLVR